MNTNLAAAASKQRKNVKPQKNKSIRYGLHDSKQAKCPRKKSAFSNGDSSDDDSDTSSVGGRHHVNRALLSEQLALRNRAEMAMARTKSTASDVFDYDGQYESFSMGHQNKVSKKAKEDDDEKKPVVKEKKESRYVIDLLRQAKSRQQEREIIDINKSETKEINSIVWQEVLV